MKIQVGDREFEIQSGETETDVIFKMLKEAFREIDEAKK